MAAKPKTPKGPEPEKPKHPGGRPTDYRPEFCAKAVELGAKGASRVEIACELGVVRMTLANWEKEHPEFLDAMTQAKELEQVWWERIGRESIIMPAGATFQSSVWSRSMAARFPADWRENSKVENTHSAPGGGPIQTEFTVTYVAPPSAPN